MKELDPIISGKELDVILSVNGEILNNRASFSIVGEELLCYSMLSNLIKNALEASPMGKSVHIELFNDDEYNMVRIRNQGAVPEEIRDRFMQCLN